MSGAKKYRSRANQQTVVAFSISYHRDNLLARGMGIEHLRELLVRLARPILRQGASLAYGGNWKESEENFTYELLRLISAEQEDNSAGGLDTSIQIGTLYNHSAWPHYLKISRAVEAQWINACRIVRVSQLRAGFADHDIAPDIAIETKTDRAIFNAAVTLSAMRRLMMTDFSIEISDVPSPERIPPVVARIVLGGDIDRYSGFLPGIFEEALVTLESFRPIYILGGFGGAAEILANAILDGGDQRPQELTVEWLASCNSALVKLLEVSERLDLPESAGSSEALLDALFKHIRAARIRPSAVLQTGLSDEDTRELMRTQSIATAVKLIRQGLAAMGKFEQLSA